MTKLSDLMDKEIKPVKVDIKDLLEEMTDDNAEEVSGKIRARYEAAEAEQNKEEVKPNKSLEESLEEIKANFAKYSRDKLKTAGATDQEINEFIDCFDEGFDEGFKDNTDTAKQNAAKSKDILLLPAEVVEIDQPEEQQGKKQGKQNKPVKEPVKQAKAVNNKAAIKDPVKPAAPQQQPNGIGFNIHNFMQTPEQVAKKKAEAAKAVHATDVILNNQHQQQQQVVKPEVVTVPPEYYNQINQLQQPIVQPVNPVQQQYVSKDSRSANDKLEFLKTKYTFITGGHKNLTHANLDSLINLLNSPYLKDNCKKHNALCGDDITLTEIPLEQDEVGRFDFAFKILTEDPKHPLKVLFNSNPVFDERTGRWANEESVVQMHNEQSNRKSKKKNRKSSKRS